MAILADNDRRWVEIELGARALAKKLDLTYIPFPLGSKKTWDEPKPSAPTEKHLYMLLPHAIGLYPPAQNFDVVVVATMSPTVFFEALLEKFGCEVTKYPSDDNTTMLLDLLDTKSQKVDPSKKLVFTVHYCRVPHEHSDKLSAPETIPLTLSLPNPDLLARLHDARYMVKKVRGLDFTAGSEVSDGPGSVEFRACVYQLIKWALTCGILCPRLELLSTEMIVFCVDEGWPKLGIRGAKDHISKETIGRLIERCMYSKVLGINATDGQLSIRTPSGRKLGFSAIGQDLSPVATDTIKRAIIRDMTSVPNIALRTADGLRRFQGEHEMYLKITVRCWKPKALDMLKADFYPVLLHLADLFMDGPMLGAVKIRIWPFFCNTAEVPREEGWVCYIGLSEMIVDKHIDFQQYCRNNTTAETLEQIHEDCMSHPKFDREDALLEISMQSQAELFGDEVAPNTGLDMNDGVDFEAILGVEVIATLKAKPEDFAGECDAPQNLGNGLGSVAKHEAQVLANISGLAVTGSSTTEKGVDGITLEVPAARTDHSRNDSVVNAASDAHPGSDEAESSRPSQRFRTAAQAMHRLKWDVQHAAIHYEVGYKDRFDGTMWKPLDKWQLHMEEEDFIPEHRIELLRQVDRPKKVVWSKAQRYDGTGG